MFLMNMGISRNISPTWNTYYMGNCYAVCRDGADS